MRVAPMGLFILRGCANSAFRRALNALLDGRAPQDDGSEVPLVEADFFSGSGRPPRRFESCWTLVQSPLISASFLARDQPLSWRSTEIASVMRSKCSDQTRRTGRRV